jgi:hypothetical protein
MARLFTTPFAYQNQTYTAVVSITQCSGTHTVMIHFPDPSLHQIVPGGTVSFDAEKGLPLDNPTLTPAQQLLLSVLTAIEQHDERLTPSSN